MPAECEPAPCPLLLPPSWRHATVDQGPQGAPGGADARTEHRRGADFGGRDRGARPRALPRLPEQCAVPAERRRLPYGCSLPYRRWPMGAQALPGEEGPRRVGWRLACCGGLRGGETPARMDAALWEPRCHETPGPPRLRAEKQRGLRTSVRSGGAPRGQGQRVHLPSCRVPAGRLRLEATDQRRPRGGQARTGFALHGAASPENAHACGRAGHPSVDIPRSGPGPGGQRPLPTPTVLIVPHGLEWGAGWRRTPARAGPELVPAVGEGTPGTLSERPLAPGGTQPVRVDVCYGVDWGQRGRAQVLPQSPRTRGQALLAGGRRARPLLVHVRHRCRHVRQRWRGGTPGPKGAEGQKPCAGQRRRALDQASATRGSVESIGRQEVGEAGDRPVWTGGPGSLPGLGSGGARQSIVPPRGDSPAYDHAIGYRFRRMTSTGC